MKHTGTLLLIGLVAMGLVAVPLVAGAISNPDIITILTTSIDGVVKVTKLAYCAAGVSALC